MATAFRLGGPENRRPGESLDFFGYATHSGLNFAIVALLAMSNFFLVVVVTTFAGETVAGEATWGSLRYLLIRPVSRGRLLAWKLGVTVLLAGVATAVVSVSGLGFGTLFFGWHPIATPLGSFAISAALAKLAIGTAYVAWSMMGVAAIAFCISTTTDAVIGPVGGAVCLAVVSEILDQITALGNSRMWLPTHYWQAWTGLFSRPVQSHDMVRGLWLQIPYILVASIAAWRWFQHKDIVS